MFFQILLIFFSFVGCNHLENIIINIESIKKEMKKHELSLVNINNLEKDLMELCKIFEENNNVISNYYVLLVIISVLITCLIIYFIVNIQFLKKFISDEINKKKKNYITPQINKIIY